MSRSRRKSPAGGMTTAVSDKPGKVLGHRKTRRAARSALIQGNEPAPTIKATENPWSYPKDGKTWFGDARPELLRK